MTAPAYPDLELCSRCRDHAGFELIDDEWLSECCSARAIDPDTPNYQEER